MSTDSGLFASAATLLDCSSFLGNVREGGRERGREGERERGRERERERERERGGEEMRGAARNTLSETILKTCE